MQAFIITIFVIVCLLQIVSVLLQASKGGGVAGAFGGGGMGAMFGSRGAATFLSKLTAGLATAFMIIALILSMMSSRGGGESQGLVEQERQARGSSPAAILPSTQSTQPLPQPVTQPAKGDSGK
jgi:preprotein translocase subunit SecG